MVNLPNSCRVEAPSVKSQILNFNSYPKGTKSDHTTDLLSNFIHITIYKWIRTASQEISIEEISDVQVSQVWVGTVEISVVWVCTVQRSVVWVCTVEISVVWVCTVEISVVWVCTVQSICSMSVYCRDICSVSVYYRPLQKKTIWDIYVKIICEI